MQCSVLYRFRVGFLSASCLLCSAEVLTSAVEEAERLQEQLLTQEELGRRAMPQRERES